MRPTLLIDRSDRGRFELTGVTAVAALNGLVTNDVAALKPGQGQYAAALTARGKIVADMVLLMLDDRLQLHTSPVAAPGLRAMLTKFVNPRFATLNDATDATADLTLIGESAARTLANASGGSSGGSIAEGVLGELPTYAHVRATISERPVTIVRLPSIGSDNASVYSAIVSRADRDAVHAALGAAGAEDAADAVMETLRVESGYPAWGVDMDDSTLPQEANLDDMHAVSYTKGCYIGQETVARIHFRGHVNRSLRRLTFTGGIQPPRGAVLQDSEHRGIGDVRSTACSEREGAIGIGMVRREIDDGSTIDVHWEGGGTSAVVTGKAKGAIS
ncbi:MAG: YgfZ/GcvT domain-containing protein [Gemmatimonadales bacterium]